VRIVNHWRNDRFRGGDYAASYNYNRTWHDHSWWVSSYPRVVFVLGGWWYWNTGYSDVTPDRIIEDVQLALQQQGYYAGPLDGLLGSQTAERWRRSNPTMAW
jgi:hypothetical protein